MPDRTDVSGAPAGAGTDGLDTYAKSSLHRLDRWLAREALWRLSEVERCTKCGRYPVTTDGSVAVRANGQSVGFAGLYTCGNIWVCPVCNAKIQSVRRLEVGVALATHLEAGGGAAFGAVTVRHQAGDPLSGALDALTKGQAQIARDRTVVRLRKELGHLGRMQALEVTHGEHGWHPHRHPLVFFAGTASESNLVDLHLAEFRAFRGAVERAGYAAPSILANVLMPVTAGSEALGDYFAKSVYTPEGAGFEMTSTQGKKARGKHGRTPWNILRDVVETGDADDFALWAEYEVAMKGKRALTHSRGLRAALGLGEETTDEAIAEAEVGDRADTGFVVEDWSPIWARAELGAGLLAAVTPAGDWKAGRDYARRHGIRIRENS